jgi:Xaa-Pro dipeptidase
VIARDQQRVARIRAALADARLDALLCTLPSNVLMVSGYWPVVGTAFALVTRGGAIGVAAPTDEGVLAHASWADEVVTFQCGTLDHLVDRLHAARSAAAVLGERLALPADATVGYEAGAMFEPSGYAATFTYGAAIPSLVDAAFRGAHAIDAGDTLAQLRSVSTARELDRVREAATIVGRAFAAVVPRIRRGMREREAAALLRGRLMSSLDDGPIRRGGFAYCMSGPNAARADAAFQCSDARRIGDGDLVLLHCNSYVGGYWTDVTRTLTVGPLDARVRAVVAAVLEARGAALATIGPGVAASEVDAAARRVIDRHGFGAAFSHPTGHGVGFAAIDHASPPRLHPCSPDVLQPGMVFNVEPGVYLEGVGGMRHCDMVAVTSDGAELLTPFLAAPEELVLR